MAAATFGSLFSSTIAIFKQYKKPVLIGAIFFTVLMTLPQFFLEQWSASFVDFSAFSPAQLGAIIAGTVVWIIISIINYAYYLVVFIDQKKKIGSAMGRAVQLTGSIIGVSVLAFLYSFAWIALVGFLLLFAGQTWAILSFILILAGVVCAFIRGPRYFLAPILIVGGAKSVVGAMKDSYTKTEGYWGKIVGNSILISLMCLAFVIVISLILGVLVVILGIATETMTLTGMVITLLYGYIGQFYQAFYTAFHVKLAASIISNPRKK